MPLQCYEQLYANKTIDDMDKFIERHKLSKLIQEETKNLNKYLKILS